MALRERGGPLAGVRILEITKVWAGPYAGKLLAFLGAEVIKVESNSNLDEMRAYGAVDINSAPYFLSINQEVLSVQVNMKTQEGMDYLRQMIAQSDIVMDNLRPGAMERLGLSYDAIKKIKPDVIVLSIKMYGTDGPLGYQTGYAPCFAALGGLTSLVGHEGEPPQGMNIRYGDSTVGASAAFAAVAALHHRESTGEGQFIDVSAVEAMSSMIGDSLLSYAMTGDVPTANGNDDAQLPILGCFPCAEGEWISIFAKDDAQRQNLSAILGEGEIADLTLAYDAEELADRLRKADIAAFKSMSSLDLVSSEFHWDNQSFRPVSDHASGSRPIIAPGWRMTPDEASLTNGAPLLGEHNDYVYRELLGLSTEELADLVARKVVD
jgi:crotonobetainyl-CoA:carnitine CoA-transferase CaiB-like acyl-CoA transferase